MTAWRATAGPPQARQGSRYARPAPPAYGLDRPASARLLSYQAVMASLERDRSIARPMEDHRIAGRADRPFFWPKSHASLRRWLAHANPNARRALPLTRRSMISTTMHARLPVVLAGLR